MALWGATGVAQAQEETQPQPSRPVFSLPPGNPPAEQPDPNVQGPRAPGVPAPRVIDPNAPRDRSPPTRQSQSQQQPPATQTQTAPTRNAQTDPPASTPRPAATRRTTQTAQAAPPPSSSAAPPPSTKDATANVTGNESLFDIGSERTTPSGPASTPAPTTSPTADAETGFPPTWLIALALLLAGGLGYLLWRRRKQPVAETGVAATEAFAPQPAPEPEAIPEPEALSEPAPVPEAEPLAAAPPAIPAEPAAAQLELDFEPLGASWSEAGLAIKFRLYLRNISDQPVHDIAVHLGIRSADQNLGPSAGPAGLPNLYLETLKAHDMSAHEGEMRLDEKAIVPVMVEGKEMVLPIVDIMPRYRDGADNMRKIEVALLVGRERNPPSPKLAPLPVQGVLGPAERLGCRMIALPGAAASANV